MSKLDVLKEFKKSILQFIDELIEQFPQESDLKIIKIFIQNEVPVEIAINNFITYAIPLKEEIKSRNDDFFLNNSNIFNFLNNDKAFHMKNVWKTLDSDTKSVVWDWFDYLVNISEKYIKLNIL